MAIRVGLLTSAMLLGLGCLASNQALAGLVGAGNTVQAFYYNGSLAGTPEGELPVGAITSDPASLATPVDYQQGAADGSLIHVGDTQIVISNKLSGPFCFANTPGTACIDAFQGFDFKFTGVTILGVSADFASAAAFLPVTGTFQGNQHLGLQLLGNNEIRVDVTGDLPLLDDKLILDVSFTPITTGIPEPAALVVLGAALAGLTALRRRRTR